MSIDQTPDTLRGIGVQWGNLDLYDDDSTYTQAGGEAGTASSTSRMRIDATGTPTDSASVRCQAAGLSGRDGARFVARTGSKDWTGWDLPVGIRGREVLANIAGTTTPTDHTACIASPDGALLVAEARYSAGINTIRVHRQTPGGTWSSVTAALAISESNYIAAPAMCVLPGGRVLLFVMVYDTGANLAQVRQLYSDNDGVSFTVGANYVLPVSLDSSSVTIGRMSVAESNGQICLVLSIDDGSEVKPYQYASNDQGCSFTLVSEALATFGTDVGTKHWDVVGLAGGGFLLAALYTANVSGSGSVLTLSLTIPSAYVGVNTGTFTAGSAAGIVISGSYQQWPALCVDDTGSIWLHIIGKGAGAGQATVTRDNGATWDPIGSADAATIAGEWWDTGTLDAGPWGMSSAYLNGSVYLAHYTTEVSAVEGGQSPAVLRLGGYTNVTLPSVDQFVSKTNGLAYSLTYAGMSSPTDYGLTLTGTATESLDGDGWLTVESSGVVIQYSESVATDHVVGQIHHLIAQRISGGFYINSNVSDGTNSWGVIVEWDGSTITTEDTTGANTGTLPGAEFSAITGAAEFLIAVSSSGYTVAVRPAGNSETPFYIIQEAITSQVSTNELFAWGTVPNGGTANSFKTISYARAVSSDFATSIANDFTSPDDLRGFPLSGTARYVIDGISLAAVGGPAAVADSWAIPVRYSHPITDLTSDSPRDLWRSAAATSGMTIAYNVETLDDGYVPPTGLVGIYVRNANFSQFVVEHTDGIGATYPIEMLDADLTTSLVYTRTGSQIIGAKSGATIKGPYVHPGQLVGSHFQLDASTVVKVTANTAGWLTSGSTIAEKRAVLTVEGVDNGTALSGTGSVWHKDALFIVHKQSNAIGDLRIRIHTGSEPAPPEGDFRCKLWLVNIHPFATQYGDGRRRTQGLQALETETPSGRISRRAIGPVIQEESLNWDTGLMTHRIHGSDPLPIYSSTDGDALPVASAGGTAGLIWGLAAVNRETPMLLIPRIDQDGTGSQRWVNAYMDAPLWGFPGDSVSYDPTTGDEMQDELARVGITWREVT